IQNPLPSGVAVQVRLPVPYLNDKASTKVGALLYLAQSKAYLSFPFLLSVKISPNRLPLSRFKSSPWSIYGSSHDESVRKGILVNPTNSGYCKLASQYWQKL
ncbi:hypothetical protein, partial [Vibrio anguillarum]|uniref:hypothetical protein n=2 Tax=Vibrio anguillarum TaxID=55601 RepID=UPI001BE42D53